MAKILAFSGSSRIGSCNQKMLEIAAAGARQAGAEVTVVNLADYVMPIYNQDLEAQAFPEAARAFKKLITEHDGLLIASPEYNSAYSALLKNAIDWASRPTFDNEISLSAYRGKFAIIMAASPGGLGGMRGLVSLRMLLSNMNVNVLASQVTLGAALQAFNADGSMVDEQKQQSIEALGQELSKLLDSQVS
ncbi:MAG: NADPH-dependent FMN reductase [Osedax symbiont Rs1]|nr:MAG: NADPH-dependent FMN reductase [Osedax symbiont Rs1]